MKTTDETVLDPGSGPYDLSLDSPISEGGDTFCAM